MSCSGTPCATYVASGSWGPYRERWSVKVLSPGSRGSLVHPGILASVAERVCRRRPGGYAPRISHSSPDLVTRIARPLLASMFVAGGLDAARRPASKLPKADAVIEPLEDVVGIDADPVELVRLNGIVQVGAGVALATGTLPHLAALALAVSLVPTTIAGHPFWREDDPAQRGGQRIHFLKNVAMLGGLLLAARR